MDFAELMLQVRKVLQYVLPNMSDEQKLEVPLMFNLWKLDKAYSVGDEIRYNDILYRCLQAHISQATWNPVDAPALWAKILTEEGQILAWEQPSSTNPYMKGDKVTHNGKTYESLIDNNVWEPGAEGSESLWVEV